MNERPLNWTIAVFAILSIFARSWVDRQSLGLQYAVAWIPIVLLGWATILAGKRLSSLEDQDELPHHRLSPGDGARIFFILWSGHRVLAKFEPGFFAFSLIVAALLFALVAIIGVELYKNGVNGWVTACGLFGFFLLSWERNMFVRHFGVPIIGHFFEKPEYDAKYYVELEPEGSTSKYRVLADVHVEGRTEEYESGEDRYGQTLFDSVSYRDVWIKRLHFPTGGSLPVEQDEPLQMGESVSITDGTGRRWNVRLTKGRTQ